MVNRIVFCFSLCLLFFTSACAHRTVDAERADLFLEMGTAHLQKGSYPEALKALKKAEELNPNSAIIQNNLGLAYFVRKEYEQAKKHIQTALDLESSFTEARINLGQVFLAQNQFGEAIKSFQLATKDLTYPKPEKSWYHLGLAEFQRGEFNKARDAFARAVEIQKNYCLANHYFARSLYELKDYQGAAENFDRSVSFCDSKFKEESFYYGGLSYYRLGDSQRAILRFEELVKEFPEGPQVENAKSLLGMLK